MEKIEIEFVNIECCTCGIIFRVSEKIQKNWLETKNNFYCPNGHMQAYVKSASEILREKTEQQSREIAFLKEERDVLEKKVKKLARKKK